MAAHIPAILLFVGGLLGVAPVDSRIAWACVMVAGLLMLLG